MTLRAHALLLVPVLNGCGEVGPGRSDTASPTCAEGYFPDRGQCVPEACGTGAWGALEVDDATVYVDIEAPDGGDGTAVAPLRSIQTALDLAGGGGGGLVAVAAGSYPETLLLTWDHAGVNLAGRCRELVTIDASVGDAQTPGIDIDAVFSEVQVSGVSVVGSSFTGVQVRSGSTRLTEMRVAKSAYVGIGVYRGNNMATTNLVVDGCEIVGNHRLGIGVADITTEVTLVDTVIRDSLPDQDGNVGFGAYVGNGAAMWAEGCELVGNTAVGIMADDPGTAVTLVDTMIRDTRPEANGTYGDGVEVVDGASLLATDCSIIGNTEMGMQIADPGTEVTLVSTTIRNTQPNETGEYGYGIEVQGGASLLARGCQLTDNTWVGIGIRGEDSEVILLETEIRDTKPSEGGEGGYGIEVQAGGLLRAEHCALVGNTSLSIKASGQGALVTLEDSAVRDTRPGGITNAGPGILASGGASLRAKRCEISDNSGAGIMVAEPTTEALLLDSTIRDTLPNEAGEYGQGVEVQLGAELVVDSCELTGNTAAGIAATDPGTLATLRDSSITNTASGYGSKGATAVGLSTQYGANVSASGLLVRDTNGPGLYAVFDRARITCTHCSLVDNSFAGAVAIDDGGLELRSSIISGTTESTNLGGGVGVFAAPGRELFPPFLLVTDTTISDNLVAGAWMQGDGAYRFEGVTVTGSIGMDHGATTRCGDGVYAADTAAWDGHAGLSIQDCTLTGNQGAGLFLDDASARLDGNSWSDNDPDLLVQGDSCLSLSEDWDDAPTSEVCPTWHQPTCEFEFRLNLMAPDVEPGMPPPPDSIAPPLRLVTSSAAPRAPYPSPLLRFEVRY